MRRIARTRTASLRATTACLALVGTLVACSDGGDDDGPRSAAIGGQTDTTDTFTPVDDGEGPVDDAVGGGIGGGIGGGGGGGGGGSGSVAAGLETAFVDENNFELWICSASAGQLDTVGYAFAIGGEGAFFPIQGGTVAGVSEFVWRATGPDSVFLEYLGDGFGEDIFSIVFRADGWTGFSSSDGNLDCEIGVVEAG